MSPSVDAPTNLYSPVNGQTNKHFHTSAHATSFVDDRTMSDVEGQVPNLVNGSHSHANGFPSRSSTSVRDQFDIAGKVYIVTGGGRGLGLAMTEALVEAGAFVYVFDCLPKPHPDFMAAQQRTTSSVKQCSPLQYRRVDVRNTEEIDYMTSSIASAHSRLDGLIAAAAIQQITPALECTTQHIDRMMSINYTGVFMVATAVARAMLRYQCRGSIVMIASMSGMIANKGLRSPIYNSTKAALIQLSKNMAMEWAPHGIRVNALCPGHTLTPMVQEHLEEEPELERFWSEENMLGRLAKVDEFKGAAIFLLSEASSFMTGSSMVIDGGHTAW